MKALVTGSSGFCGQHLLRYLREKGVEVFTLGPRSGDKGHYQIQSVTDLFGMVRILQDLRPDLFFHLAGILKAENPTLVYQVNSEYGLSLLHALELAGQENTPILFVGTAAEYGLIAENDLPVSEDFVCAPYNHYGISKLTQTLIGLVAARQGRPVVIARAFNIIGPGMPDHLVVANITKQVDQIVKRKRSPTVEIGNTKTSRDFIDVSDAVAIYWKLIQTESAYGEVVNVCTGQPTAIGDLLEKIIALSAKKIEVVSKAERFRACDPSVHYGSTEKLGRLVGYVPKLNLENTLRSILCHLAAAT